MKAGLPAHQRTASPAARPVHQARAGPTHALNESQVRLCARAASDEARRARQQRRPQCSAAVDVPPAAPPVAAFPRGAHWAVHKFGGTCVSAAERIREAASVVTQVQRLAVKRMHMQCCIACQLWVEPLLAD